MTANRRRLPDNCTVGHDISIMAMLRSSDRQWDGVLKVARGSARLLALQIAAGAKPDAPFTVELADGRQQTGRVDCDGNIHRDAASDAQAA